MTDPRYVELVHLTKAYPNPRGDAVVVVDDVNLVMRQGEVVSLIGHSGCGKSTILTMVAGLNPISAGSVVVDGKEIAGPGPDRAVVFQSPCLLPWLTAAANVRLGVDNVYPHAPRRERDELVAHYLHLVGLGDSLDKRPRELSQGMQQRVGIARALALRPKVLLLDEPFGMLDSMTRLELQDVLLDLLAATRSTAILVTHDVDEAIVVADRVVMLTTGPRATIGQVLTVPFERPRDRDQILDAAEFLRCRQAVLDFLEEQDKHPRAAARPAAGDGDTPDGPASDDEPVGDEAGVPLAAGRT